MKKFLSLGLAAILTAGLATSCKDDVLNSGDVNKGPVTFEDDGRTVSFIGALTLPNSNNTRSETDTKDDGTTTGDTNSSGAENMPDYEYGYDYENTIQSVLLVFANDNHEYVTHSKVTGITQKPKGNDDGILTTKYADLVVTGEIKHNVLEAAYHKADPNVDGDVDGILAKSKVVYVYAFCNYTARMLERFEALAKGEPDPHGSDEPWYNWGGIVEEEASPAGFTPLTQNSIWSENSFMMTSASKVDIDFPATIDEWDQYADKSNPYKLGKDNVIKPIDVERVAARLDFKDGSPDNNNTYPIYVDSNNDGKLDNSDLNIISVQLNRMCLVNMGKEYYYLRRVSNDGLGSSVVIPTDLVGVEHMNNYVVDYDWLAKSSNGINGINVVDGSDNSMDYFNFPLYTTSPVGEDNSNKVKYNRYGWFTDRIKEDVLENGKDDTWTSDPSSPSAGSYKIWRYVTENTIPGIDAQQTKQSTGIVFKGRIVEGKDITKDTQHTYMSENVKKAITEINKSTFGKDALTYDELTDTEKANVPYLFSFNNILYAGPEEMIGKANEDGNNGPLHQAVSAVLKYWKYNPTTHKYEYETTAGAADVPAVAADDYLTVEAWVNIKNGKLFSDGERSVVADQESFQEHCAEAGITVYRPYNEIEYNNDGSILKDDQGNTVGDGWGYYCYYFYWNRHNDNHQGGKMGNMEFATVRNNVYKLSVTNINKLGHPRVRTYDPDPVDPDDPDEDPLNYIQVQVRVLPWVVRENFIEF